MKLLPTLLVTFLLGAMFLSLFSLSLGMESHGMTDCLFMQHSESICEMTYADLMNAWQSTFLTLAPTVTSLLLVVAVLRVVSRTPFFVRYLWQVLSVQDRRPHVHTKRHAYSFVYLRELFSNGILHPKLFA